ncbi:NAD(P)/FAD-dependent oxidoreductase [Kitasatospora sp. GP82]|uniref:FAD-dependent oxidoreductase n=1 Tax=Kitasatospora sp. GP82 TaxID=3035089 RepID=UPI00247525A2|nr:NAD(P)/FAD-dependent oxidoreductase [Kitasatospora sp. GP82]MDH6124136.1 2-polyprenyl-6-methoxyphenol hydroxylase-like FAD-dependent oxidoreductase [Kitasatospora sp. GP82]
MRVLVIGAGVGGLCLAQGLLKAGIDVRIYEREPGVDSRYQGFRIGLGGAGLDALRACLPQRLHALLEASTGEIAGERVMVDQQLKVIGRLGAMYGGMATDRHVLRHLLLAGLKERIEFGKRLVEYVEQADGTVTAVFADGSTATGDLLVGADGVGSPVRRQLLPHAEVVALDGRAVLGRTPLTDRFARLVPGFGTIVRGSEVSVLLGRMEFRRPPHLAAAELAPDVELPAAGSYVRWVMFLPEGTGELPDDGWAQTRELLLKLVDGWHPDLVELIRQSDVVNSSTLTARYAKPVPHWGSRRVTLLGDAIHVMPPSGGKGANTAFRDAALLCRRLTEVERGEAELLTAVERYEREMLDHGFAAVAESLEKLPAFTSRPVEPAPNPVEPAPNAGGRQRDAAEPAAEADERAMRASTR